MWLNKLLPLFLFLTPAWSLAEHLVECPPYLNIKSNPLVHFQVFDGPLSDKAFLAPNTPEGNLDVSGYANNDYNISLLCHYKSGESQIITIPKTVKRCTSRGKKMLSVWCE